MSRTKFLVGMKVKVNDVKPWYGYVFREGDSLYDNYIALVDSEHRALVHVHFAKLEVIEAPSAKTVAAVLLNREMHHTNIIIEYSNIIKKDKLEFLTKYGKEFREYLDE
jgi:hypothetical protein